MAASTSEALARRRATYQDVLDAPPHRVAETLDIVHVTVSRAREASRAQRAGRGNRDLHGMTAGTSRSGEEIG